MGIDFATLGFTGWLLLFGALAAVLLAEAMICAAVGNVAGGAKGAARFVAWPFGLALGLLFLPGFLLGALLFGFMTPPFNAHLAPPEQQSWPQRGLNRFLLLVTSPSG